MLAGEPYKQNVPSLPRFSYTYLPGEGAHSITADLEAMMCMQDLLNELFRSKLLKHREKRDDPEPDEPLRIFTPKYVGPRTEASPFNNPTFHLQVAVLDHEKDRAAFLQTLRARMLTNFEMLSKMLKDVSPDLGRDAD